MPIAFLHATRVAPSEADGPSAAPALPGVTERLVPALHETVRARARRKAPGAVFTLVFHALAVAAFVPLWHGMARDLEAPPEAIAVEVVSSVPEEAGKSPPAPPPAPKPAPAAAAPPPPPPPAPKLDALKEALAMPAPAPDPTPPQPSAPAEKPPQEGPRSGLAEPPPEPKAAATRTDRNEKANTARETPRTPAPAAPVPAPRAPAVLTAEGGDTSVPLPSPDEAPKPAEKPAQSEAAKPDAPAQMAAALPMSSLGMPSTFRAMLSAQGSSESQEYKGAVYGALRRAAQAVDAEAQRRHLRGNVAVNVVVSDTGAILKAAIVQSSGSAQTDALALETVRRAAPFPPPPPGTTRSFNPVIQVGAPAD